MRQMLALVVALAIGVGVTKRTLAEPSKPLNAELRLQFRLVAGPNEKADTVEVDDARSPGAKVTVSNTSALDGSAVATAEVTKTEGKNAVLLKFKKEGSARLEAFTTANVNRQLAIIVDGKVIFAPVIRASITDSAIISGGGPDGLSKDETKAILDAVRAAKGSDTPKN